MTVVAAVPQESANLTSVGTPFRHAFAVTPSDTDDLPYVVRALYIGVAGDVKVDTYGGESAVVIKAAAGRLDIMARRVYSTGTAATNIVGLY